VAELVLLVMALVATTLINPYGIGLPREWLETLTMPLPSLISEHMPLDLGDPIGVATIVLAAGYLIVLLGVYPNRPRVVWLLPLVWFVLALQRVRNDCPGRYASVFARRTMAGASRNAGQGRRIDCRLAFGLVAARGGCGGVGHPSWRGSIARDWTRLGSIQPDLLARRVAAGVGGGESVGC
jgi:hypothetical protein